jgi:hypothetical protein
VSLKEMQVAQGRLLQAIDQRVGMLTKLMDLDHAVLEKLAGLPPRPPEGGPLVN